MPRTEQMPNIPSLRVAGFEALRGGWVWAPADNDSMFGSNPLKSCPIDKTPLK
jgi:hypothetical protein